MSADTGPGLKALNPVDTSSSDKESLGEKRVLREVVQKVEELLGVLGRVAGVRHGTRKASVTEPRALDTFLEMNHEEGFDLEVLNSIDMRALGKEARGEKQLLRQVMEKVEQLSPRVRSETEDASLVGPILRNKTLEWYRRSPTDPDWAGKMVPRWGGIFHESRVPGGRLSPKLSARLENLRTECEKVNGWAVALHRIQAGAGSLLVRIPGLKSLLKGSKRPLRPLMAQVAQAYLDDLAASGRRGDRSLPMERLSRLARRIGSAEMNITLGMLFPQEGGALFLVLDPHLHPDTDGLRIRPPLARVAGEPVTYDLTSAKASVEPESRAADGATIEASFVSPWDREDITKDDWNEVLGALQKHRAKLNPPPVEDYRKRGSYLGLRELLLADPSARAAFLSVHWKGKPSGLTLLDRLLCDGTFAPEAETDGDYLEAELTHLEKGDPDRRPPEGRWNLGYGWTVVRELTPGNMRTYRADHGTIDSRQSAPSLVAPGQNRG